jgi:DNA repair protein RecN (Recombination protein N)
MLTALTIKNYALIDDLNMSFNNGLSIITGETGAGKSILLGALGLILGKRVDVSSVKDASKKCIIEAEFDIANYHLKSFFKVEGLDFETQTIIRREILPSGKSRAFINDSPVNLNSLQALGVLLLDIHSQHQTLELTNEVFQFKVIDALANTSKELQSYSEALKTYKQLQTALVTLKSNQAEFIKELDYNVFLLKELEDAKLSTLNLSALESDFEELNNVEAIKESLGEAYGLLSDEQVGVLSTLKTTLGAFQKLSTFGAKYEDFQNRINSVYIELDDVFSEIEIANEALDANPEQLAQINSKLTTLHNLFQKHTVSTIEELVTIENGLQEKVEATQNLDDTIAQKQLEIDTIATNLDALAQKIHTKRTKVVPVLISQLETLLKALGMPNAQFEITLDLVETYFGNGKNSLAFLFSANKGTSFNELKKVASGGELSRIMLSIKYVLSKYIKLPTIMFDEIDTGVSGEVSAQIANMLLEMRKNMQVFSITHSPQIAAKGDTHFKVYKEDVNNLTSTNLVKLNEEDRIVEIAQMLGGLEVTNSAVAHAKQLLN